MAESGLRRRLVTMIREQGIMAIAVENYVLPGTPDIWWGSGTANGWIETKLVAHLPRRPTTPLRLPGLTIAQRAFHEQALKHDVRSLVVLRVAETSEWVVIPGRTLPLVSSDIPEGNPEDEKPLADLLRIPDGGVTVIPRRASPVERLTSIGVLW